MVISYNSQLGLRFSKKEIKVECMTIIKDDYECDINNINNKLRKVKHQIDVLNELKNKLQNTPESVTDEDRQAYALLEKEVEDDNVIPRDENYEKVWNKVATCVDIMEVAKDEGSKYFFICESVYKAAELIRVNQSFTGRTMKDIAFGKYTYLMGKDRMVRFVVDKKVIHGLYYDEKNKIAFQFGCDIEDGGYSYMEGYDKEFSQVMQILTFVELGDIEILELKGGGNNGLPKNNGKVTNTAQNTVYVVDSSWNKLIIRTDGFAVRGHFRLQPCGDGMRDRKLIWISAFEKSGYKRTPKAEIIR